MTRSAHCLTRTLLLLAIAWTGTLPAAETGAGYLLIDQVESVLVDTASPPPASADWQPLQLPFGSRTGDPAMSDRVMWMRFTLHRPQDAALYSLYFYRRNLSLDLYFNGEKIGGDPVRPGRQTVGWNHPLLVDIQNANWRDGSNTVHVRYVTSFYGGTFAPMLFGARSSLQPLYEQRLLRQVEINEALQVLGIVTTILACVLWSVRRRDPTYLLFAGMTACWSVVTTHMVVHYNLLDYRYWLPLVHIAIDLFALLMYCFLVRHIALPSPRGEKAMKIWAACAITWHLFAPLQVWWIGAYGFHVVGNSFIVYLLARIVRKAVRERDSFAIAISLTLLAQIGLFGHDVIMVLFTEAEDWENAVYYSQLAFPLLLAVFAATLLHRFVTALNHAENLNRDLEAKVEASRQIIEQSYATRRQWELDQAAAQERLSIYRDLHDDVGSKLLSIVHADRGSRLGELARTALESLRNAVSRANSPEQSLAEFVAVMREEAQLRLEGSGHAFHSQQNTALPAVMLSSAQVFNLNQVVRELVSNIIRHAHADAVSLVLTVADHCLQLRLADNGKGLDSAIVQGNGLAHIRQRVAELQGQLEMTASAGGGLQVQLTIPLDDTSAAVLAPVVPSS